MKSVLGEGGARAARLLLLAGYALGYLATLGVRPLFVPDEFRYAEISREMLASGDWITPRLAGLVYFEKPVLGYWLGALSIGAFGENRFALRLTSALAAGVCAWLVGALVRRSGESEVAALLAAGVLLTCALFFGVGTFDTLDSLFACLVSASLALAFLASEGRPRSASLWALAGACAGLAFLAKGFLGFALPGLVVAPYLVWERRWRAGLRHAAWAPLVALAVPLPWAVAIHLREPAFWADFVWREHIQRFVSDDAQHPAPFWYFAPVLLAGALPWTLLAPAAVAGLRARVPARPLLRFALCWLVLPFAFFSLSRGKLGTYILPCFPALGILVAIGLDARFESGERRLVRGGLRAGAWLFGLASFGGLVWQGAAPGALRIYGGQEWPRLAAAASALLAASLCFAGAARSPRRGRALALATLAPTLLCVAYPFAIPDRVTDRKAPGALLRRHAARIESDALLLSDRVLAPPLCWFTRRTDVVVVGGPGELREGAERAEGAPRVIPSEQLSSLVDGARRAGRQVVLATSRERYARWSALLPPPSFEDALGEFVFSEYSGARPDGLPATRSRM